MMEGKIPLLFPPLAEQLASHLQSLRFDESPSHLNGLETVCERLNGSKTTEEHHTTGTPPVVPDAVNALYERLGEADEKESNAFGLQDSGESGELSYAVLKCQGELWSAFADTCLQRVHLLRLRQEALGRSGGAVEVAGRAFPALSLWQSIRQHIPGLANGAEQQAVRVPEAVAAENVERNEAEVVAQQRRRFTLGLLCRCLVVLILFDAGLQAFVVTCLCFFFYGIGLFDPLVQLLTRATQRDSAVPLEEVLNRLAARRRLNAAADADVSAGVVTDTAAAAGAGPVGHPDQPSIVARAFYQLVVVFVCSLAPWWSPDPRYIDEDLPAPPAR